MQKYVSLVFDVVNSRLISDRYRAQRVLLFCIDFLNAAYSKDIVKKVVTVAGDEFQGLFSSLAGAVSFCRQLQTFIFPIRVRCGIGYGTIKYLDNVWTSVDIDGDAYYNAREAIDLCKDNGMFQIAIKGTDHDRYLNMLFSLLTSLKQTQTVNASYVETVLEFLSPIDNWNDSILDMDVVSFIKTLFNDTLFDVSFSDFPYNYRNYSRGKKIAFSADAFELYFKHREREFHYRNNFYIEAKFERGTIIKLADIFNTSPQNISSIIKNGKMELIRNTWCSILDILEDDRYA